jgi:predicted methyltransferase
MLEVETSQPGAGSSMATIPTLNDETKKVLRVLLSRSNIAGYDLMSSTDMPFPTLMEAVTILQDHDLIQVVGNSSTQKDFEFSRFAVLPAAKSRAGMLIK